jgi:hypothetical protein
MEEIKNKKLTAKFDTYIFLAIRISLVLSLGVLAAMYWLHLNKIWLVDIIAISALVCFSLMIMKEVVTGKVYANNAKKRRKKFFPFLYATKKKSTHTNTDNELSSSSAL